MPGAIVPDHHGAAAVFAFGNDAFEAAVFERMIFDVHREALDGGIEARSFGHGPREQNAVELEAEIVMEAVARCFWMTYWSFGGADFFFCGAPAGSGVILKLRFCL